MITDKIWKLQYFIHHKLKISAATTRIMVFYHEKQNLKLKKSVIKCELNILDCVSY